MKVLNAVDDLISVDKFIPRIEASIGGADHDMLRSYIVDACIQFAMETKCFSEVLCVELRDCVDSYVLSTPYLITEISNVRFFNGATRVSSLQYYVEGDTLYVDGVNGVRAEVELCLAPLRDSEYVPAVFYELWAEGVVGLTLYKLCNLGEQEFFNQRIGNAGFVQYQQVRSKALANRITRRMALKPRLLNMRQGE